MSSIKRKFIYYLSAGRYRYRSPELSEAAKRPSRFAELSFSALGIAACLLVFQSREIEDALRPGPEWVKD